MTPIISSLQHPLLGPIVGVDLDQSLQYRGIPYATLEHQLADAVLFDNADQSPVDGTKYGPQSIQPSDTLANEHVFIQHSLPHAELRDSATQCLNLNITVPKNHGSGLPVLVFMHGGGYTLGAGSWPQFDMHRLVALSSSVGKPIIGVTINYRLGAPGFLTSEELRSHGISANRGFNDQIAAFTWLKKNIEGFGGDPQRVTAAGVSVGSISILLHLSKNKPIFQQAVCMGGTQALVPPLPLEVAESAYDTVLTKLNMEGLAAAERVDKLKSAGRAEWLSLGRGIPLSPTVDTSMENKPVDTPAHEAAGSAWCPRIMMGDCALDSSILAYMLGPAMKRIGAVFIANLDKILVDRPDVKSALVDAYDLKPGGDANMGFLYFAHDVLQLAATRVVVDRWPGAAFVFHFNEPNPWEGRFKGVAGHLLDVAFLFQNYSEFLDEEQAASGRTFGLHLIEFVNGQEPYPPYSRGAGKVQVYGPGHTRSRQVDAKDLSAAGRRDAVITLAREIGLEKLIAAAHMTLHP